TDPQTKNTPLLDGTLTAVAQNKEIGLIAFVTNREYRLGFRIVPAVMFAQQLTRINAVVFYSVSILQDVLPNSVRYLNRGISGVNFFMIEGVSLLFDRVSPRTWRLASMLFMGIFAFALATNNFIELATLSAIVTLLFVMSFPVGMSPLPWMVASRKIERMADGAAQFVDLISNWMGTLFVSFAVAIMAHTVGMHIIFVISAGVSLIFFGWGFSFCNITQWDHEERAVPFGSGVSCGLCDFDILFAHCA
ncbi:hypothetical protein C7212DRAFT_163037, partial [Tuber magnatum]